MKIPKIEGVMKPGCKPADHYIPDTVCIKCLPKPNQFVIQNIHGPLFMNDFGLFK
jgi:hypothetical protein